MSPKKIIKTENKLNKTILKAKRELEKLKRELEIIVEIKEDFFFDWLNF
jgi:hypothetical protein